MSLYKDVAEVEVRERRLNSVLSFHGFAKELLQKSENNELTLKVRDYGQCSSCAFACSQNSIAGIRGAVVIGHSPIGCSSQVPNRNLSYLAGEHARGLEENGIRYISSNIEEKDTIYGASEKLREALAEADRRFSPEVVFIQGSCASGIIGEDMESIAAEAEAAYGYPVIQVHCEGFKSRVWSSGFDASYHGILRKLVKPPKKKQKDLVNIFSFIGSDTFTPLLSKLNLKTNYMVTLNSLPEIAEMSEAVCSTTICETLSTYVTRVLEDEYGVPNAVSPPPYGIDWTDRWLREIASYTGRKDLVEEVIAKEHERIAPRLKELKEALEGKTIYVLSGQAFAYNLANVVKDFGVKIVGLTELHHVQQAL